ncbi:hypothetical protein [Nesterenkonia natronophila]|uniref:restriction system modified-DNA reader domain-containing protein n=1 Tax=Nesterenkonia natronophila TaxID=2174932 RepID=UPI001314E8D7
MVLRGVHRRRLRPADLRLERLLKDGDSLSATHRDSRGKEAVLMPDGTIELDGTRYRSPSAAGHALRRKSTNGWYFWAVNDGRRIKDVRTEFQSIKLYES